MHANAPGERLRTIDATCPLVTKVHVEARKFAADGYTIVLIGHDGHEEVEGTMGEAPESIVLVRSDEDVDRLEIKDPSRIAYISQTTLSVDETRAIINRLRERFPAIVGPRTDDICYATTNRQTAVKQLARECDLVLVIGSRNSSNSNRLVEVARELGADSHLIDNERQVQEEWLDGQAENGYHLRGERAGGTRPAPRRLLPRPRNHRLGARRDPGGRPLHAAQGDPPGAGGRVGLGPGLRPLRTLVVSDLHLGAAPGNDVVRHRAMRTSLVDALSECERLVLLGDVIELATARAPGAGSRAPRARADRRGARPREVVIVGGITTTSSLPPGSSGGRPS